MKQVRRFPIGLSASVAVPFVLIATLAATAAFRKHKAPSWRLPMAAYDPRDILRGRYLNVRFKYHLEADDCADCCVCLTQGDFNADPPSFSASSCDLVRTRCDQWMTVDAIEEAYRYFIPEARAQELEAQVIDATQEGKAFVHFVLDARHAPQLTKLTVYGEALN